MIITSLTAVPQVHMSISIVENQEVVCIGSEIEIYRKMCETDTELIYYSKRPLGQFFVDLRDETGASKFGDIIIYLNNLLESDKTELWKKLVGGGQIEFDEDVVDKEELEEAIEGFEIAKRRLEELLESDNPLLIFIAISIWQMFFSLLYVDPVEGLEPYDLFYKQATKIIYPMYHRNNRQINSDEEFGKSSDFANDQSYYKHLLSEAIVAYPSNCLKYEYAYSRYGLLGLRDYYINALSASRYLVDKCTVCGAPFLNKHKNRTVCCDACAKKKAKINQEKRRSNDDVRRYERLTNNTRQYITRCFKKLDKAVADRKIHGVDSELVHKMKKETEDCIDRYNKEYLARNITLKDLKKHHSEVTNRLDEVMAKNGL